MNFDEKIAGLENLRILSTARYSNIARLDHTRVLKPLYSVARYQWYLVILSYLSV